MSLIEFAIENWQTFGIFSVLFVVIGFVFKGVMNDIKLIKAALEKHIEEDAKALEKHIVEGNQDKKELKLEMEKDIETNKKNIINIYEALKSIQSTVAEIKGYLKGKEEKPA